MVIEFIHYFFFFASVLHKDTESQWRTKQPLLNVSERHSFPVYLKTMLTEKMRSKPHQWGFQFLTVVSININLAVEFCSPFAEQFNPAGVCHNETWAALKWAFKSVTGNHSAAHRTLSLETEIKKQESSFSLRDYWKWIRVLFIC